MNRFRPYCRLLLLQILYMLLLLLPCATLEAQLPIAWDKTLGGSRYEELNAIQVVSDGLILGGSTNSPYRPGDFSWNFWIAKLDFDGKLLWQYTYGGDQDERLWALIPTADGGFLAGGYSYSGVSGDRSQPSRGDMDFWIVKLDALGKKLWDNAYGGLYRDELFAMLEMNDGGFLLAGHSNSEISGDKTQASRGSQDFWLVAIDKNGAKRWDQTLGGDGYEQLHDLEWAPDRLTVFLSGGTLSNAGTGEMTDKPAPGGMDFWLLEFDPFSKNLLWNKRYGGTGEDFPYALTISRSGLLYLGGRSGSQPAPPGAENNGRTLPNYGGDSDYWLLALDTDGNKLNEWAFGGQGLDDLYFVQENTLGQLILGGVSDSDISGNKTSPHRGGYDYWLVTVSPNGPTVRQQTIAGTGNDALTKLALKPNGALVLVGHSDSNEGFEKSEQSLGVNDFWVVTTECDIQASINELTEVSLCGSDTLRYELEVNGCQDCRIEWSTGDTSRNLLVPPGLIDTFIVVAQDNFGCISSDTIIVKPPVIPTIFFGTADTILQTGQKLTISGSFPPGTRFTWNTGDTTSVIAVGMPGRYSVTVTFPGGCSATDGITVFSKQQRHVYVPNVFSPDFDGYNDFVNIYTDASVRRIVTFQIADRWGGLVFQRDDYPPLYETDGWNGIYRGRRAEMGVYSWFAIVEFIDGVQELFEGSVCIVR